jgi:hypothetical protein
VRLPASGSLHIFLVLAFTVAADLQVGFPSAKGSFKALLNWAPMRTLIRCLLIIGFVLVASYQSWAATPMPMMAKPASSPTPAPPASASEQSFISKVTKDLQSRFGTTAQAAAAGYFRYTNEDNTGAISWVNTKYWTSDPQHPSQLWYDVKGNLIGVDFSLLVSNSPKAPSLWGVSPSRWFTFDQHDHFGIKTATGVKFGAVGPKSIVKVGGSASNPTAEDIVKLGKAKSVSDVAFVFEFPAIWDLEFWVVPNPLGAFAEHNPNVIPSANAEKSSD